MKKLLLLVFICVTTSVFSQNFYEATWTSENVNYTALIEFFTTENINVRVNYTIDDEYRVAKYKANAIYDSTNDYYFILGSDASIVYPYNYEYPTAYSADNFYFTNSNVNNVYEDLYTYDNNAINSDGTIKEVIKATYRVLNPYSDFTEQYIYNFFEKHESEYITYTSLISGDNSSTYTSTNSSTTSTNYSYDYDKLYFENNCNDTAELLIQYKNLDDEWVKNGWYSIAPGDNAYIANTKNSNVYWYAEDATGSWTGEYDKTFKGKTYGFRKWVIEDENWGIQTKGMNCNTSSENAVSTVEVESEVKIHLIFAADVDDPSIGHSTREDMNDVTNLLKKASKELNVKFESYKLYGNNFDKNNINSTIENLSIKDNDVVIFYYSGHGYNNTNNYNKFPYMSLDGPDLSVESIHEKLKNKNARLTLTIGDLCNSIPRMRNRTAGQTEIPFKSGFLFDNQKLKKLFIETKGDLISTSSKKGQWSYTMGNDSNGHFTNAFIDAFTKEASKVSNFNGSWTSLFSNAYEEAKYKTRDNQNQDGSYGQSGTNTNDLRF